MSIESTPAVTSDNGVRARLQRFFFAEEIPYGMALARIALPFVLFCSSVQRWYFTRELYSADGALAPLAEGFGVVGFLPELPGGVAVALNTAMLFFLLTSCIGWQTRFSLGAATVLFAYFGMLDCLSTMTKYTVVATHALLLLTLSQCGTVWSVDSWLAGRSRRSPVPSIPPVAWPKATIWPQRLAQILVGAIYFGAAITKFHTPTFFSGDQLIYWMMTTVTYENPLGDYLTQFPSLIVMFCYITVVWEVLFLFFCWKGWPRRIVVALGVTFHVMTVLTLGLLTFCAIMVSVYLMFLSEADVQWLAQRYRRIKRRVASRLPAIALPAVRLPALRTARLSAAVSAALFAVVVGATSLAGVGAEYALDPYGERGPNGPLPLRELSQEEVEPLFAPEEPIREIDKFLSFDIGTLVIGGRLVDRRHEFRQGQKVVCEASMNPPHADTWVECNLHDDQNRLIHRTGTIASREMFHIHFYYTLGDGLVPGDYTMVLRSRGQEILRYPFVLKAKLGSPVAN